MLLYFFSLRVTLEILDILSLAKRWKCRLTFYFLSLVLHSDMCYDNFKIGTEFRPYSTYRLGQMNKNEFITKGNLR